MHWHFDPRNDGRAEIPRRAFARLDHIERDVRRPDSFLASIDLIDAEWMTARAAETPMFDLGRSAQELESLWSVHVSKLRFGDESPMQRAPLYRLELEVSSGDSFSQLLPIPAADALPPVHSRDMAAAEASWLELQLAPCKNSGSGAALYSGLFATPTPVVVKGSLPTPQVAKKLSAMFSLSGLPQLDAAGLVAKLQAQPIEADYLAVFDVGQGNANALVMKQFGPLVPTLYYDLGAGVYRNAKTAPADLRFCFTQEPLIILSHWDTDHWAGTYARNMNGTYPALERTWVAPQQQVTTSHLAFAFDVITSGGEFFVYTSPAGSGGSVILHGGSRRVRFIRGDGTDRNGSGIAMAVDDRSTGKHLSWLLTGDCDYVHLGTSFIGKNLVGVVAPHHGASLHPKSPVPPPPVGKARYRRLVYSFGPDNAHGSGSPPTRHPTKDGAAAHRKVGWTHLNWKTNEPGLPLPAGDVLATSEHDPGVDRGGAVIGWYGKPPAMAGCPACNAPCPQR